MPTRAADRNPTVTQAQFDRLTGANRDDWRKWTRRRLVSERRAGYEWRHLVEGLALRAVEDAAGLEVAVQTWDDVHAELLQHIRQPVLDIAIDPGTSTASRPRLRASVSTDDSTTAALCRAARFPILLPLAGPVADARSEFERIVARATAHADRGTPSQQSVENASGSEAG
jgi:hypothetical protein